MFVSARDIKRKATFEPIRLKIFEYAKSVVDQARRTMTETDSNEEDEDDDDEVISDGGESTDDESENVEEVPPTVDPCHLVKDYKFGLTEFYLLTERLGYQMNDFVIKLDLFDGYLTIRTVPGAPHGVAVGVFTEILNSWARDPNTPGIQGNPLIFASDASMYLSLFY